MFCVTGTAVKKEWNGKPVNIFMHRSTIYIMYSTIYIAKQMVRVHQPLKKDVTMRHIENIYKSFLPNRDPI